MLGFFLEKCIYEHIPIQQFWYPLDHIIFENNFHKTCSVACNWIVFIFTDYTLNCKYVSFKKTHSTSL